MANKVSPQDIKHFNELYYKYHTYAAVARETGFSAGTVSKYIDKNWKPVDTSNIKHFYYEDLPQPNVDMFKGVTNFGDLCIMTDAEYEEIKELWEELEQ